MVSKMTLREMNNVTIGYVNGDNGCVGKSGSVPRLGFPGFCLHDAGNGVRATDGVNAYASGVSIGASWNATLAYQRGQCMGREFQKKGVQVALGPVVGPIGRIATGGMENHFIRIVAAHTDNAMILGRNWEGFTADPYIDGILGAQSIRGLQESVIASVKHFVANVSSYGIWGFTARTHADTTVRRNKKPTATLSLRVRRKAVLPTWTIKQCTNYTYGPSRMLSTRE
jgi:beta-glucosidase